MDLSEKRKKILVHAENKTADRPAPRLVDPVTSSKKSKLVILYYSFI
jgi:hypothetical protein